MQSHEVNHKHFESDNFATSSRQPMLPVATERSTDDGESWQALSPLAKFLFFMTDSPFWPYLSLHSKRKTPLLRPFLPSGTDVQIEGENEVKKIRAWQAGFSTHRLLLDWVWSPTFLGLLANDLKRHITSPEQRYGYSLQDLFLGARASNSFLSLSMIETMPWRDYLYHPLLLVCLPLLASGAAAAWAHYVAEDRLKNQSQPFSNVHNHFREKPWDLARQISEISSLADAEVLILHDKNITPEKQKALCSAVIELAKDFNGPMGYYALSRVYNMLFTLQASKAGSIGNAAHLKKQLHQALIDIRQKGGIKGQYAEYLLWLVQSPEHRKRAYLHVVTVSLQTTLRLRYWLAIVWAIKLGIEHTKDALTCDTQWRFVFELGQYVCGVCADWQGQVNVMDLDDPEACLTQYLQHPHTSTEIRDAIEHVLQQFDETHNDLTVDLTQQNWANWPMPDWQIVFLGLQSLQLKTSIAALNLSSTSTLYPALTTQLQNLQSLNVTALDLSEQAFAPTANVSLPAQLQSLSLANVGLDDTTLLALLPQLQQLALQTLSLAGMRLGKSAESLADALSTMPLSWISLASSSIEASGWQAVFNALSQTPLTHLDLSEADLSKVNITALGALIQTQLTSCITGYCQLTTEQLQALSPYIAGSQQLMTLDLSGHYLDASSIHALCAALKTSAVKELILDHCQMATDVQEALFNGLTGCPLDYLSLRGINLQAEGLQALADNAKNLSVTRYELSDNHLDHPALLDFVNNILAREPKEFALGINNAELSLPLADAILQRLSHSTLPLALAMSGNRLEDSLAQSIVELLTQSGITRLDISHNQLTDIAGVRLADVIADSQLEVLNLSGNTGLSDLTVRRIANSINQLTALDLSATGISKQGEQALSQALLTQVDTAGLLSDRQANADWRRWFYDSAVPASSNLTELNLANTALDQSSITGLCRAQNIYREHGRFFRLTDSDPCVMSGASTLSVQLALFITLLTGLIQVFGFGFSQLWPTASTSHTHTLRK